MGSIPAADAPTWVLQDACQAVGTAAGRQHCAPELLRCPALLCLLSNRNTFWVRNMPEGDLMPHKISDTAAGTPMRILTVRQHLQHQRKTCGCASSTATSCWSDMFRT